MYSEVHDAIHSSPTVNEYPQQTPQNPQVLGTCPGYIMLCEVRATTLS